MFVQIRDADDAIIGVSQMSDRSFPGDNYEIVTEFREFHPAWTVYKWIYNCETQEFANTGDAMTWE